MLTSYYKYCDVCSTLHVPYGAYHAIKEATDLRFFGASGVVEVFLCPRHADTLKGSKVDWALSHRAWQHKFGWWKEDAVEPLYETDCVGAYQVLNCSKPIESAQAKLNALRFSHE